jgi:glycosyltransferase involved in cell wall biosynthesis
MFKIGIIDVAEREGGRRTFVDNLYRALKENGHDVHIVDFNTASLDMLNSFDILHFSSHFMEKQTWKLLLVRLLVRHPKKLVTIHGWVGKEKWYSLKHTKPKFGALYRKFINYLLNLAFLRISPFLFDAITCPSESTAEENGLKNARIISNALFAEDFEKINGISARRASNEILFVTYVSIGGLKNLAIDRVLDTVVRLNEALKSGRVTLLIFGKDYLGNFNPYVRFMGYSHQFLEILKSSDLFITGKKFPDIGYAEMEAGFLGIPIAKFTEDYGNEEIIDGNTGILAKTEEEMVSKLLVYVLDLENNKRKLGKSFQEYVKKNKSWSEIVGQWNQLFLNVCAPKYERDPSRNALRDS